MTAPAVVWFRRDLRLADHPALHAAVRNGGPVIPVYVDAPEEEGTWAPGRASRAWLAVSLAALDRSLRERGSRLLVCGGPSAVALVLLARATSARTVFWNELWEPEARARDERVRIELEAQGIEVRTGNAALLHDPRELRTRSGGPFRVFTPFYRACIARGDPEPALASPRAIPAPKRWPSLTCSQPGITAAGTAPDPILAEWNPGEEGARKALRRFLRVLPGYAADRDRPAAAGTSRLSPHLHFGEIGPRQVWQAVRRVSEAPASTESFLRQILWREFAYHILHAFPKTPAEPLRSEFASVRWTASPKLADAWRAGRTGYPWIDAGMRQLLATGWMHNRVRMAAASFLSKDLLVRWQDGARWFWDTLLDADLANNTFGWQWAAGCGADAAPYFRVFHPVLQGERFDPEGLYVRRWIPELRDVPDRRIHRPWESAEAAAAGYPAPIVDHAAARIRALSAFRSALGERKHP